MAAYQAFVFDSYYFDPETSRIELNYSLDDAIHFQEILTLPAGPFAAYDPDELSAALFGLHLIGGISYYKTDCPPKIQIRSGALTAAQARFWDLVYENGLGEFFYRNNIDFRGLIRFPHSDASAFRPAAAQTKTVAESRLLTSFGGGKDSLVSVEMLRDVGTDMTLFRLGTNAVIDKLADVSRVPMISVKRSLSPELFRLNAEGALNGHIPITAYISFLTIVVGVLYGYNAVVMSNERSASFGNVEFNGVEINHQWSKGLDFEMQFDAYVRKYITGKVRYLSLLRPLSELPIAGVMSRFPEYFSQFTSCNANWKILGQGTAKPMWCGQCPKCAFAFALLAAFVEPEELARIFGANLFDSVELIPTFRELLGIDGFKPFECVGTPQETQAAVYLAIREPGYRDTLLGRLFTADVLPAIADPNSLVASFFRPDFDYPVPDLVREVFQKTKLLDHAY